MNLKKIGLYAGIGVGALLVVMAVAGGTVALFIKLNPPQAKEAAPAAVGKGGTENGPTLDFEITEKNSVLLKPFVTNLADADRPRYINVTFELVTRDQPTKDKVTANLPVVRDAVVAVLNSKKALEVTGEAGANSLKDDILKRINTALGSKLVAKVLVTDLVVQY